MARQLCEDKSRNMVSSSSAGFCYSDVSSANPTVQTHMGNPISVFDSNQEIFNLTTGMEMIGFSRNLQHHQQQQDGGPDDDDDGEDDDQFNNHDHHHHHLMVGPESSSWQQQQQQMQQEQNRLLVDDSSFRCVFPCEGIERPSQGLSLSLSSANPSSIGLQSFELRHTTNHQEELRFFNSNPSGSRDGFLVKPAPSLHHHHHQHQQHMMQDDFMAKSNLHQHQQGQFQLRNSKYLAAVQELLNEFCSLQTKELTDQQKIQRRKNWDDEISCTNSSSSSSSSRKQSLYSLEFMELQKRKTKLLSMLEEVDRRYRRYCDQMKAVVSSFEAVVGAGTATVYLSLASKAMSRHFRCLKDGILAQICAIKKAMGEKDPVAPGTTRGETPRLKVLDQTLRQQRSIQQMNMMESHPWRPQRGLPERSVSVLRAWLFEHFLHPYPSDVDKHILARQTGLSRSQVSNWFINARVRLWKPMIEEMYTEEAKEQENNDSDNGMTDLEDSINTACRLNHNPNTDQKPTPDQLIRIDSECLSSLISNSDKNDHTNPINIKAHNLQQQNNNFGSGSFGAVELHFSSYNHHSDRVVSYANQNQNFNGGGVSLTLGLQQHGESGVSLAFSPASQSSLFYPRDHIDECQPVQYSILDGSEAQNLPYRNLMGAQLLHDLAG